MPDICVLRLRAFELGTGACSSMHPVTLQPIRRFVIDMLASSPHGQHRRPFLPGYGVSTHGRLSRREIVSNGSAILRLLG